MKKYKYVFFDLDRTIWDFKKNAEATFHDIYSKHQLNLLFESFDKFMDFYENINEKLWDDYRKGTITKGFLRYERFRRTFAVAGNSDEELIRAVGDDYVFESPKKTGLLPNAREILSYLKSNYKLFIITNGFKEVQNVKLQNSGLTGFFEKVYISEDIGIQKPDVRIMKFVLNDIGATANECIMIGDDQDVDIACARNAGMDQVFYNNENKPSDGNATHEISDLTELRNIL
jgi:putative hydrolase of the HAD superfamily